MSIIFDPKKFIQKIAPAKKVARLVNGRVGLKKTALAFVNDMPGLDKKKVAEVALKTINGYKERIAARVVKAGFDKAAGTELKEEILDDPKQLINRVQNEIVYQVHQSIKDQYRGERGIWLPSDAEEPRPEHQLNYGKEYIIGEGIGGVEPGDEPGCQCGVEILVNETQLTLE